MGEIFELRNFLKERRREPSDPQPKVAEILFFTGVRYQKHSDASEMAIWAGPKGGPGTSRRKRKA